MSSNNTAVIPLLLAVDIVAGAQFVILHGPGGQMVQINRNEIVSLRQPRGDEKHFHQDVQCLIFTADGKFTGVTEDCGSVSIKLENGD